MGWESKIYGFVLDKMHPFVVADGQSGDAWWNCGLCQVPKAPG